jgi:hypothetical protein
MNIEHTQLLPLLDALVILSPVQQEIFLFCLKNCPEPKAYSGDLLRIRESVGCNPHTTLVALRIISASPVLSQLVKYRRVNHNEVMTNELLST